MKQMDIENRWTTRQTRRRTALSLQSVIRADDFFRLK